MRIGEIAAAVGVTTRAVRHYHHLGLLPEPERRPNGYRVYTLRHAVVLARIRRLTELGLGLAEVRDVLADERTGVPPLERGRESGRELAEVLAELDQDLARQEAAIRERRARLRELLDDAEAGRLPADAPVSPELGSLLRELDRADVGRTGPASPMAAKDRELLALIETTAAPEDRDRLMGALRDTASAPGAAERAHDVYARLDALADARADDPRVDEAARALADCLPEGLLTDRAPEPAADDAFLSALFADFAPAQAEAVRRAIRMVAERDGR
ncbi:MerR family transcriptional regulator [Streptomyces sp. NPDC002004]